MKTILYSGVFDLLHLGHLLALEKVKQYGDRLVVHIASDQETKSVKGMNRPIVPGRERERLVKGLRCVDDVIYTEGFLSFQDLLDIVKPDIVVRNLGGFSKKEEDSCQIRGVSILKIPREVPQSSLDTTGILKKLGIEEKKPKGVNYILVKDGQILLQRRDDKEGILCPGMLAIPGGGIDEGENALESVIREIKEEIGVNVHETEVNFLCDFQYPWGDIGRYFVVSLKEIPEIISTEGKMEWHNIEKIDELAGGQEKILKEFKDAIRV